MYIIDPHGSILLSPALLSIPSLSCVLSCRLVLWVVMVMKGKAKVLVPVPVHLLQALL